MFVNVGKATRAVMTYIKELLQNFSAMDGIKTQIFKFIHSTRLNIGWMMGVPFPAGAGNSLRHCIQTETGFGTQPATYPVGARSSFPGGKGAGA